MGGYRKSVDPIASKYILEAIELEDGDMIVVPMNSQPELRTFRFKLYNVLAIMKHHDSTMGNIIRIEEKEDKGKFYLMIKKVTSVSFAAVIVKKGGGVSTFYADKEERMSKIKRMLEDNISSDHIKDVMGELTEDEQILLTDAFHEKVVGYPLIKKEAE